MKRMMVVALLAAFAAGCGSDKADNSKIQSPNDQAIGMPSAPGGGGPALKGKPLPLDPKKK